MSGPIRRKVQLMAAAAKTLTIDAEAHVIADDPAADHAPGGSDNRWLAEVWEAGEKRLRWNRMYVGCQSDDVPCLLQFAGKDDLIMGLDYGHADTTSELAALSTFRSTSPVGQRIANKMLGDNARTLYAL